jgi:hypothetical protein
MCIMTVPVSRGGKLMGGVWQREQCVAKTRSPSSAGGRALSARSGSFDRSALFVEYLEAQPSVLSMTTIVNNDVTWIFIFYPHTKEES